MSEPARVFPAPFAEPYTESAELTEARAQAIRVTAAYREALSLELESVDKALARMRQDQPEPIRRGRRDRRGHPRSGVYKFIEDWARENPGARTNAAHSYDWAVAAGWKTKGVLEPRRAVATALAHLHGWGRLHRVRRGVYEALSAEEQAAAAAEGKRL